MSTAGIWGCIRPCIRPLTVSLRVHTGTTLIELIVFVFLRKSTSKYILAIDNCQVVDAPGDPESKSLAAIHVGSIFAHRFSGEAGERVRGAGRRSASLLRGLACGRGRRRNKEGKVAHRQGWLLGPACGIRDWSTRMDSVQHNAKKTRGSVTLVKTVRFFRGVPIGSLTVANHYG